MNFLITSNLFSSLRSDIKEFNEELEEKCGKDFIQTTFTDINQVRFI